jgi:hypothetical protein
VPDISDWRCSSAPSPWSTARRRAEPSRNLGTRAPLAGARSFATESSTNTRCARPTTSHLRGRPVRASRDRYGMRREARPAVKAGPGPGTIDRVARRWSNGGAAGPLPCHRSASMPPLASEVKSSRRRGPNPIGLFQRLGFRVPGGTQSADPHGSATEGSWRFALRIRRL